MIFKIGDFGYGMTFTLGRGNEIIAKAVESLNPVIIGWDIREVEFIPFLSGSLADTLNNDLGLHEFRCLLEENCVRRYRRKLFSRKKVTVKF